MMINPHIEKGMETLRSKWPQAHHEKADHGAHLIIVPAFLLPPGYNCTIATVLFVAPPGFPAAQPDHFFTHTGPDELELDPPVLELRSDSDGSWMERYWKPKCTNSHNTPPGFPQWHGEGLLWWSWHLQHWDPNRDTLMTYMNVIRSRLKPAR